MKAYAICFVLTITFTFLAQTYFKKNKKNIGIILSLIAILIPSFIAGVRQVGVGRDIENYVQPVLKRAINSSSFKSYLNSVNYVEIGYGVLIYIISLFSSKLEVSLFFIQLIPCTCVYIFAYKYRDKLSMTLMMSVYLLLWYLRSFTIMRQSIAIGFILIGIIFFNEKKYFKSVIMCGVAILFHNSAILAMPIFIIFYIFDVDKISNKQKIMLLFFIAAMLFLTVMFYEQILYIMSNELKIIPEKYYEYINSEYNSESIVTSYSEIIYRFVSLILGGVFLLLNRKKNDNKEFIKYYFLLIIEIELYLISFKITNGERIGYYYRYIGMLYCITAIPNIVKKDFINRVLINGTLLIILFTFWYWKYPIQKNCETYPYKSSTVTWLN